MKTRKVVFGAVALVIGLPLVLVLAAAATFQVLNRTSGSIISSGQQREYLLYVPESYDPARPTPLVISMHAAALWPAAQMKTSHWNAAAEEHGFIAVYPSGAGIPRAWHATKPGVHLQTDVMFISDLIDTLAAAYNIDPTRIYANGLSNGAGMAFVLSCTMSHRIAAVGTVAAAHALPFSWCTDSQPMPMISFHGTADRLVPYNGGTSWASPRPFPPVPTWSADWARRNRCGSDPVESVVATDVMRLAYTNCADDADVVLYTIREGGHAWPGGTPMPEWLVGSTSHSIDATREMWAFFSGHRRVAGRDKIPTDRAGGS